MTEQYRIAEVTRLATDGTKNACSFLYSRAARAARAMGFDTIQTFILESEPGTSLRAAGWTRVSGGNPKGSNRQNRPGRSKRNDGTPKQKWAKTLGR